MKIEEEIISGKELFTAFCNADFGKVLSRDVVRFALLKYACGYSTGHTIKCILIELGLITEKLFLTKKGKEYLFVSFYDGNSY